MGAKPVSLRIKSASVNGVLDRRGDAGVELLESGVSKVVLLCGYAIMSVQCFCSFINY